MAKILNNLQVTVKNIHVRYEDNMSVPGVRLSQLALIQCLHDSSAPLLSRPDTRQLHRLFRQL
jgi:hypothetical protein